MPSPSPDWVSASEIASYSYCARAYWLERVVALERSSEDAERLEAGQAEHAAHGRRVALGQWLVRVAILLLVLAAGLMWATHH